MSYHSSDCLPLTPEFILNMDVIIQYLSEKGKKWWNESKFWPKWHKNGGFSLFFYEKKKDANIVHNIGLGHANNIDASHTVQFGILLFHLLTNSVI